MGVPFFLRIVMAVALAYLPFAGWMSVPWTGDQKVYLSTAIEMEQQRSLLVPYLFGEPSYYKPPLQYWSTLAGFRSFGFSLWGAFVPSVLATLVAALAIASIARRLFPSNDSDAPRVASRAALWFLGCLGTATFGVAAQMEIYLVALGFTAWALALSYLDQSPRSRFKKPWALYGAYLTVGALAWVKSPLYSVLWVFGYVVLLIFRREWREFRNLHFYLALTFGSLLGASWYLAILEVDRERFVSDYILRETLSKQSGNAGTPIDLWLALLGFSIPFVLLAVGALVSSTLKSSRASFRRLLFFAFSAGFPAAFFFTI
ncbi:MAG: glycosyltransferase family 39 protein, partial [Bdellovibrionales bacterium]|nr:glycosyltransferase family 39 protein [Bdellovibrionales bacterium]